MEYYSKCNVCGKIICYTDKDLKDNTKNSLIAGLAAISSISNAIVGTRYDMYESEKLSERVNGKVVDYYKCPNCGSKDLTLVTKKFAIFSNKVNGNYSVEDLLKEANNCLEKKDYENAFCFSTAILNEDEKNYNAYLIRFLSSYEVSSLEEIDKLNIDYSNNQHFKNLLLIANETQKRNLIYNSQKNKFNSIIKNSTKLLEKKDNESVIEDLKYYISELKNYDNEESRKLLESLNLKRKEIMYKLGCNYLEENDTERIEKAINIFEELDNYKDSENKLKICNNKLHDHKQQHRKKIIIASIIISSITIIIIITSVILNNRHNEKMYKKANLFVKQEKYSKAIKIYEELGNYKDSKNKKKNTSNRKIYNEAINNYNKGLFEDAATAFEKIKDYEDSLELAKKAELYDHIKNYCLYQEYFTKNMEEYELVNSDEKLNNLFPNNWFVGYLSLPCSFEPEYNICNSDGTISKPFCKTCSNYSWKIINSFLYYNVFKDIYDLSKYEVRKLFDDTYLLYDVDNKKADLIMILENSDTADKINFKIN